VRSFFLRRLAWSVLVLVAVNATSFTATSYLALRQSQQVRVASYEGAKRLVSDPSVEYEPSAAEVLGPYAEYVHGMLRGDVGTMPDGTSVPRHVLESLPPTLVLLGAATAVALAAGTLIGVSSVGRRRPRALAFNVVGFSMPAFYIGIVGVQLSLLLARVLGTRAVVLPSMGFGLDRHLILPVLALALRPTAEIARLTAESLSAEMTRDYVRTARAVGHPPRRVLLRHAWTNIVSAVMAAQGNAMRI
jgi:peptide/nickel transport system permease protein